MTDERKDSPDTQTAAPAAAPPSPATATADAPPASPPAAIPGVTPPGAVAATPASPTPTPTPAPTPAETPPAPASEGVKGKGKKGKGKKGKDDGKIGEGAGDQPGAAPIGDSPFDKLREHQQTMLIALAVVVALVVIVLVRQKQKGDRDAAAWAEYGQLVRKSPDATDGFGELAAKYDGSAAEPFIKLTHASRLYSAGTKEDVTEARRLLQQIAQEQPDNPLFKARLAAQIEKIGKELEDPRAVFLPKIAAPATPAGTQGEPVGGT